LQKLRAGGLEQQISNWQRDITYTLDYLSTRADIDANRIAYVGLSFGSNISPYFLHYQSRFKTAVLWSGGIFQDSTPEAAVLTKTLLKRVEIPTLMINGRHDYVIPLDSQEIFFNLLGTPSDDKKHVVFNSGHSDWPIGAFVKENLDWLDKYLGPVEKP
jgi:dienelactone hydrolase